MWILDFFCLICIDVGSNPTSYSLVLVPTYYDQCGIPVCYQNQNHLQKYTTKHMNFRPECKTGRVSLGQINSFLPWISNLKSSSTLMSKIQVFGSTFSSVILILVPNRNCIRKSLCRKLTGFWNRILYCKHANTCRDLVNFFFVFLC